MNKLVKNLKENNQDFEFYPTTDEIIEKLHEDLVSYGRTNLSRFSNYYSFLDIGTGSGQVFEKLEKINKEKLSKVKDYTRDYSNDIEKEKYKQKKVLEDFKLNKFAIEKSKILIDCMPRDILLVGTDFLEQSLIDKNIDITFSNPPYSQYEAWLRKILSESNSSIVYMVIPQRWENLKYIQQIVKDRKWKYSVLGEYDFKEGERTARAKVHLIRFDRINKIDNAFDYWFDTFFKIDAQKNSYSFSNKDNKTRKEQIKNEVLNKNKIIPELVKFYNKDLEKLLNTYKALETLDYDLLMELNVDLRSLKENLKNKIEGLKQFYWEEMFDLLEDITKRFTSKKREMFRKKLTQNTNIDFTELNIYSLLVWMIKHANVYFDDQIKDFYLELADKENIINYKSNKKIIEDNWRYFKKEMTHFSLDYRIIKSTFGNFGGYEFERKNNLRENSFHFLQDIFTIAYNLGFNVNLNDPYMYTYESGKRYEFYYGEKEMLMDIKFFKNGNIHIRFCQEFIKKLNVEAARLNGWVKNAKEASEEFDVSFTEAEQMFNSTFKINSLPLLSM